MEILILTPKNRKFYNVPYGIGQANYPNVCRRNSFGTDIYPMEYYFITGSSKGIGEGLATAILARTVSRVTGIARGNTIAHPGVSFRSVDRSDVEAVLKFEFSPCAQATKIVLV